MERGSINGTPVWIRVVSSQVGERLAVKEAPFVDGAVVQRLGIMPERITVEFKLVNDGVWVTSDASAASAELRATIVFGGPFTVFMPSRGELRNLDLAEPATIKPFDEGQEGIAEGTLTLIELDPFPVLEEDASSVVTGAISALSLASQSDLADRIRETPFDAFFDNFNAALDWMLAVQSEIASAFQPVNDVIGDIASIRTNLATLATTPRQLAFQFYRTGARLLALIPALAQQGDAREGSSAVQDPTADVQSSVMQSALDQGADYDSEIPPTQGDILGDAASDEDLQENAERAAAQSVILSAVVASVCFAATSATFATGDSIVALAESLSTAVARALGVDDIDREVYEQTRIAWKATLRYLQQQAGALPRIRTYVTQQETDVYTLLPILYAEDLASLDEVEKAVSQIVTINEIDDPFEIIAGTSIRYLDPVA